MRKGDEDSLSGIEFVEVNKTHNLEDYQQERVKIKDGFEFGYDKYIKVHKKTFSRVVYQDQVFSIKTIHVIFKNDEHNCETHFYCCEHNNTPTAVKVFSEHKRLSEG